MVTTILSDIKVIHVQFIRKTLRIDKKIFLTSRAPERDIFFFFKFTENVNASQLFYIRNMPFKMFVYT